MAVQNVNADLVYAAVVYSFCCSVVYVIGYTLLAPWWENPQGRGMASFSAAISLVELPSVLRIVFGLNVGSKFFLWYYITSFFLAGSIELYRLYISYQIQQQDSPHENKILVEEDSPENYKISDEGLNK